jgi:glucans biosynthesis protein
VIDVEATVFPRQEIAKIGVAPLTSMFAFNATNRAGFDDFRPAVHDSDGLLMLTGAGEWLWRPLANPRDLQISAFQDRNPRGFGLMQRSRDFEDFQDPEARYERRPSLWIEPLGDWGKGFVELVEIPTANEYNDNIVAYWRPSGPAPAAIARSLSYRMRWTNTVRPAGLLMTRTSHAGLTFDRKRRLFVIDFAGRDDTTPQGLALEVSASAGEIAKPTLHGTLPDGSVRVSFELDVEGIELSELRARLLAEGKPASETWMYRWTVR